MYVITYHHDYDQVLLGPIDWNAGFISSVIQQDLDLLVPPVVLQSDVYKVPYDIMPNVRAREAKAVYEEINPKIQQFNGPFWSYPDDVGVATFVAVDKQIDLVKGELKQQAAASRYDKEVAGFEMVVEGQLVYINTDRSKRATFFEKLATMQDDTIIPWKFGMGFIDLTKPTMIDIAIRVNQYVQTWFDWEAEKTAEINAATTLAELNDIIVTIPSVDNPNPRPPTLNP